MLDTCPCAKYPHHGWLVACSIHQILADSYVPVDLGHCVYVYITIIYIYMFVCLFVCFLIYFWFVNTIYFFIFKMVHYNIICLHLIAWLCHSLSLSASGWGHHLAVPGEPTNPQRCRSTATGKEARCPWRPMDEPMGSLIGMFHLLVGMVFQSYQYL